MDNQTIILYIFYICVAIIMFTLIIILIACGRVAGSNDLPIETHELDIYDLKTGDIIGCSYKHFFGWFVSAWFHSAWSHCGIIWIDPANGQKYVLEGANYGTYKNFFKIPLSVWLRLNKNSHIGLSRINKEVDANKLITAFNKRADYTKLDSFNYKWYRLLYKQDYFEDDRDRFTCYEMVIMILQDAEVVQKLYACSSYHPSNIMEGELDFCEGYELTPPVLLDIKNFNLLRECEDDPITNRGCCSC